MNKAEQETIKEKINKAVNQKNEKNIIMAVVAYIFFFIPLFTDAKNDPFVKYHLKQALALFIAYVIIMFISWIPFTFIFILILDVVMLVLFAIGITHAIKGEEKPLPLVGMFADKINL